MVLIPVAVRGAAIIGDVKTICAWHIDLFYIFHCVAAHLWKDYLSNYTELFVDRHTTATEPKL